MSTDVSSRIVKDRSGWYFLTPEGPKGPFESDPKAKKALSFYLVRQLSELRYPRK